MKYIALSMTNCFLPLSALLMYVFFNGIKNLTWLFSALSHVFPLCAMCLCYCYHFIIYLYLPQVSIWQSCLPLSMLISKIICCFSCCPAQAVMHYSYGYTALGNLV